ncbi:MAG: Ig-like domain-containing protein [Myxococcales bacterium]|nr:Ig-like domain-containing protein [Myxococcales bacterium]
MGFVLPLGSLIVQLLAACTCNQGDEDGPAPEVAEALETIEGTVLQPRNPEFLPPLILDGSEAPRVDVGGGVQVLQIAPVGPGRSALQAAVVFDRTMVALTDLDSMNQSAALSCSPEVAGRRRWAGTSTAVFVPDAGSFPRATAFRCVVPQGTTALDGTELEKELAWTFETPRPRVQEVWPYDGQRGVDLQQPVMLTFDQPVDLATVEKNLDVRSRGRRVAFTLGRPDDVEGELKGRQVQVTFVRVPDSPYSLKVRPGVVGQEGPLPSTETFTWDFETYPPLTVKLDNPDIRSGVDPSVWLRLEFSTPVSQKLVSEHLKIDPKPESWAPPDSDWESEYWGYGLVLKPRTKYTLEITNGLEDTYDQTLQGSAKWTFNTGDYEPVLNAPAGLKLVASNNPPQLPYKHLNASSVDISVAPMTLADLGQPEEWYDAVGRVTARDAERRTGEGVITPNNSQLGDTDLAPLLDADGFGWIATRFSAPNIRDWEGDIVQTRGLMVVTDLSGTMKIGPGATDVWVTSLSQGTPLQDVTVEVYAGTRRIGSSKTDAQGLARVSGAPTADWVRWEEEIWAVLRKGTDRSLVRLQWNDGLSPYNFNIWSSFEASGSRVAAHGYTDRGVYRPGDPVYARITFRDKNATGLDIPRGSVEWSLDDPEGETVSSGKGSLDARGGYALKTELPKNGALGDYYLRISGSGQGWSRSEYLTVMARAYRPPAFRVEVSGPEQAVAGESFEVVADARYLFGASLSKGEASWSSWSEPRTFEPDGWDGWSFGPEVAWWDDETEAWDDEAAGLMGSSVAPLQDGRATYSLTAPKDAGQARGVFVEAYVSDVDRQAIANRTEVLVHPAKYYVGVRAKERLPTAGEESTFEVVAVDFDGKARSGASLQARVIRRTWDSVRERGMDGQWRWVTTKSDEEVMSKGLTSGSSGSSVTFTPKTAGYYVLEVRSRDDAGNEVVSADSVYVVGSGFVGWGRRDDNKLELVPDKASYAPGSVARILVKTPVENLRALVTAEREGVLFKKVVELKGTATTVEVPIEEAYRPNVFVSVVAVQGAGPQDAPDKGRPQVFMGMTELEVDAEGEHLAVTVTPQAEEYRPRDTVSVSVKVEQNGAPVSGAGVSLYAVDEAILSLTAYQTPDPHGVMYAHRGLSVLTADGRVAALDRAPFLTKGAAAGGDGGEGSATGPENRSKFLTTITWQPDLKTADDGTVTATFQLPDNLTTFRVMAVADAGSTAFGSADKEIRVSRPLMVRPALPRGLRSGDVAFAGVVVHNNFVRDRHVEVAAKVDGPVELTGSPVTIRIPANESVEVPFTLRALEAGEAKFTFEVVSGPDRDGVEWSIPVARDVLLETVATAGAVPAGLKGIEQIARPDNALQSYGGLQVDLASTALIGSGAGLDYLLDYPHGCVEQKTSRALASLMGISIRERAGIEVPEANLRANVEGVLREMDTFQTADGGFGYWRGSQRGHALATSYVLELMGHAKERGFKVDQESLDDAVDFLRSYLSRRGQSAHPLLDQATQARAALALALVGQGDAGLNQRLYNKRRDLPVFAIGGLLQAIVRTTGADGRTRELERVIASRTTIEAASASVKENDSGTWARMWASDDLSTASALEALMATNPEHPLGPKYALHLASSRRTGHWANTRATAGALAALAAYADARETQGDAVGASVSLAGQSLMAESIAMPGSTALEVPMTDVQNGPLYVEAQDGLLYYMARMVYAPKDPVPRDEGFTITRSMELIDGGNGSNQVVAGANIRVTLTVVTPVVRHDVAVLDRIPAGLEPMDTSFATTRRAPQEQPEEEGDGGTVELPDYGGSWVYDHYEIDDTEVKLYADYMPPGVHTFRYMVRATTPGTYAHPPASAEEMYEPENFGRTSGGTFVVGAAP